MNILKNILFYISYIIENLEKIELGYHQLFMLSANFDIGVDDLNKPKLYMMWCGNMNTHISLVHIVSYKFGHHMLGKHCIFRHLFLPVTYEYREKWNTQVQIQVD